MSYFNWIWKPTVLTTQDMRSLSHQDAVKYFSSKKLLFFISFSLQRKAHKLTSMLPCRQKKSHNREETPMKGERTS